MSMITENVDVDVWRSRHTGGLFVRIETVGTIEFLTLDGARAVAAALIEAADRLSGPTGATLTPSDAPTGTGGSDNESEAL